MNKFSIIIFGLLLCVSNVFSQSKLVFKENSLDISFTLNTDTVFPTIRESYIMDNVSNKIIVSVIEIEICENEMTLILTISNNKEEKWIFGVKNLPILENTSDFIGIEGNETEYIKLKLSTATNKIEIPVTFFSDISNKNDSINYKLIINIIPSGPKILIEPKEHRNQILNKTINSINLLLMNKIFLTKEGQRIVNSNATSKQMINYINDCGIQRTDKTVNAFTKVEELKDKFSDYVSPTEQQIALIKSEFESLIKELKKLDDNVISIESELNEQVINCITALTNNIGRVPYKIIYNSSTEIENSDLNFAIDTLNYLIISSTIERKFEFTNAKSIIDYLNNNQLASLEIENEFMEIEKLKIKFISYNSITEEDIPKIERVFDKILESIQSRHGSTYDEDLISIKLKTIQKLKQPKSEFPTSLVISSLILASLTTLIIWKRKIVITWLNDKFYSIPIKETEKKQGDTIKETNQSSKTAKPTDKPQIDIDKVELDIEFGEVRKGTIDLSISNINVNVPQIDFSKYFEIQINHLKNTTVSKVYLHYTVIIEIDKWIKDSFIQMPVKEVGGFLLGKFYQNSEKLIVSVEKFVPAINVSHNSRYELDFGNSLSLDLYPAQTNNPELKTVGWFHTHPYHSVFLSGDDVNICSFFNEKYQIAMVVDPLLDELGIFTWKKRNNEEEPKQVNSKSDDKPKIPKWSNAMNWLQKFCIDNTINNLQKP